MRPLIIILSIITFTSCKTLNVYMEPKSSQKADTAQLDSSFFYNPEYQYKIRKDDKISISVWGQDELSVGSSYGIYNSNEVYGKWLMVDDSGTIEIPKLGTFCVEDLTVQQLKYVLKMEFGKWILNPVVDVKILNKEITVMGEVRSPKVIQVDKDQNSLFEIIAKCEGFDTYANLKYVKILRQNGDDVIVANVDITESGGYLYKNIQLYPGDVVVVPSRTYKEFDRRVSIIIPFTTAITAAAILITAF
ncbi:polysaccharide export protein [bacterium SCSIO 12643]|nr:polysaccharide export protein [bacterium SCSIO 12643]